MKKNNKGSAIIIGMFLMIILTLGAYVLLAFILPFAKNTKGIENASVAYYYAYAGVEESLLDVKSRSSITQEYSDPMGTTATGIAYQTTSSGGQFPVPGEGNSDYDNYFDKISLGSPIQLQVGGVYGMGSYNWWYCEFMFKVPAFTGGTITLSGGTTTPIINWTLSSDNDTLMANSSSYFLASDIFNSTASGATNFTYGKRIDTLNGEKLDGTIQTFQTFYNANCVGSTQKCSLKLSLINPLYTTTGLKIPYLEYTINPGDNVGTKFPLYYTTIDTSGKSYGFKKDLNVRVPQQTTNQAFDFTLFQ